VLDTLIHNIFGLAVIADFLLCRQCGHEVMTGEHLINVPSGESMHARNATILGQNDTLIQLFRNLQGKFLFQIILTTVLARI